jgi:hypothetical protein
MTLVTLVSAVLGQVLFPTLLSALSEAHTKSAGLLVFSRCGTVPKGCRTVRDGHAGHALPRVTVYQ